MILARGDRVEVEGIDAFMCFLGGYILDDSTHEVKLIIEVWPRSFIKMSTVMVDPHLVTAFDKPKTKAKRVLSHPHDHLVQIIDPEAVF